MWPSGPYRVLCWPYRVLRRSAASAGPAAGMAHPGFRNRPLSLIELAHASCLAPMIRLTYADCLASWHHLTS